jgi:uncharacterized protein YhaN
VIIEMMIQIEKLQKEIKVLDEAVDELIRDRDYFAEELSRVTKERDAARRDFCNASYDDPYLVAKELGWDCFKDYK